MLGVGAIINRPNYVSRCAYLNKIRMKETLSVGYLVWERLGSLIPRGVVSWSSYCFMNLVCNFSINSITALLET